MRRYPPVQSIEEVIQLAKKRGPWRVNHRQGNVALIRNPAHECPVHAAARAAGAGYTQACGGYTGGDYLGLDDELCVQIIMAADSTRKEYAIDRRKLMKGLDVLQ